MTDPDIEAAFEDITKGLKTHRGCSPGTAVVAGHSVKSAYDDLCVKFSGVHQDDEIDSILLRLHHALKLLGVNPLGGPIDVAQRQTEPVAFINGRLEDLAEANAIYGKDNRLGAPDKIARNEREISWLKELRSMILTPSSLSSTVQRCPISGEPCDCIVVCSPPPAHSNTGAD